MTRTFLGFVGAALFTVAMFGACSSSSDAPGPPIVVGGDAGEEPVGETEASLDADVAVEPEAEAGEDPSIACRTLKLAVKPFEDAASAATLRATASDFTLKTSAGDWNLKANFSGCDVYLFVQDAPKQNQGFANMWESADDFIALFASLPKNVHLFFTSNQSSATQREASLKTAQSNVQSALSELSVDEQEWWRDRVHYVTGFAGSLPQWVGTLMASPGWGLSIDRFQKIRFLGSYGDPSRFDSAVGWFGPNISMVANEAVYYNFEAARDERLGADKATVVELWKGATVSAGDPLMEISLPDAATLSGYDTLELDLSLTCGGEGEEGYCPIWDYNTYLYLCEPGDKDAGLPDSAQGDAGPPPPNCPHELGHWITSYHREGRWVHDVSGILPLLADGGKRTFKFGISDPWVVDASLRFSSKGKGARPAESIPLFIGEYSFDEKYNDNYPPVTIAIPADAGKVEIAHVISGHGMSKPGNCAEFCNTDHHFLVNGTDNKRDFPMVSDQLGCMAQVAEGTVPNQYGTWWYGRGGWCPGKQVDMVMIDVSAQVTKGSDNTFEYKGFWKGKPYLNGADWRYIHLTSWVVISR